MKKSIFTFALILVSVCSAIAQTDFQVNTKVLSVGLALGNPHYGFFPAAGVNYDHGIVDDLIKGNASIGVGGYLGAGVGHRSYLVNDDKLYSYLSFGFRGTFHYQFVDDLDTYAGVSVGGNSGGRFYFYPAAFAGARYYVSDNFAWFAEVGSGLGYLSFGGSFRF